MQDLIRRKLSSSRQFSEFFRWLFLFLCSEISSSEFIESVTLQYKRNEAAESWKQATRIITKAPKWQSQFPVWYACFSCKHEIDVVCLLVCWFFCWPHQSEIHVDTRLVVLARYLYNSYVFSALTFHKCLSSHWRYYKKRFVYRLLKQSELFFWFGRKINAIS